MASDKLGSDWSLHPSRLSCLGILLAGQARPIFPFTAIVGQEEMKLALILNVIDPKIGGVMIMGDRGTGKSTTIRALADLLPEMPVIASECPGPGL
jgi:Mg-chelatase subunit ChlI